ncbi:MAG: GNAT family N-acetyltransferase [Candidatus Brocadiaceae bacterium]|nr:GNAT family N-acetyltransferase [Candidatus Brocadiaceae bacterium]
MAQELLVDPYVVWHARATDSTDFLLVGSTRDSRNLARVYPSAPKHDVWLEAHDESAASLLHGLPARRSLFFQGATSLGLRLIQEAFVGAADVCGVFCVADRSRFQPVFRHEARKLEPRDWQALERCDAEYEPPGPGNDWERVYGSYKGDELAGYAWAWCADGMAEVHVKIRPEHWRQGYGQSVVSAATEDMLRANDVVLYHATGENNLASLRLCLSLGFTPIRTTFAFTGVRRA